MCVCVCHPSNDLGLAMLIRLIYRFRRNRFLITTFKVFISLFAILFFCEYGIFWWTVWRCHRNTLFVHNHINQSNSLLRALILTDTHLLGSRHGNWLDQLKREWQMHISFKLSFHTFEPNCVFFLGDSLDEGQIAGTEEFKSTVSRFHQIFPLPPNVFKFVVVGNHDIGFHDRMRHFDPYLRGRFEQAFNAAFVKLYTVKGQNVISINSMALHGDGCDLCQAAVRQLQQISIQLFLKCSDKQTRTNKVVLCTDQRPIVITHFPLYRSNDAHCDEMDSGTDDIQRLQPFIPTKDCLSKMSTRLLLQLLQPRIVFTGHTHHGCITQHRVILSNSNQSLTISEWTLASFNWRNRPLPSFLYAHISNEQIEISKCILPNEYFVLVLYVVLILVTFTFCGLVRIRRRSISSLFVRRLRL